jgi:hypothetical protein
MGLFKNKAGEAAKKASKITGEAYHDAGNRMARAITQGGNMVSEGQQAGHDYLTERDALDYQGSQGAKSNLMGLYGLEGGTGSQQTLIDQAQNSPLYNSIVGTREAGEDSIMRNAAATGGLRSGNVQRNMYDFNQRLDERALLESYNQQVSGLEGISGWNTNESEIGQYLANIKGIEGQGIKSAAEARGLGTVGAGQAIQSGRGGAIDAVAGVAGAAAGNYAWSDPVLKDNVVLLGDVNGHNIYEWTWNRLAESLGLFGTDTGVMASEIEQTHPWAVGETLGYQTVNYDMLGV